ncbi:MAG TPA: class I SAM-dependent methyltransferase [Candidatus Nanopelagicales bacterium]
MRVGARQTVSVAALIALAAAVLAGGAAAVAGVAALSSILVGLAVLLLAGLQVIVVLNLRRTSRQLNQVARAIEAATRTGSEGLLSDPSRQSAEQLRADVAPTNAGSEGLLSDPSRQWAEQLRADVATTTWNGRLPVPPQTIRFMQDTDASFVTTARTLVAVLARNGLHDTSDVLDVGCGYGRLAVGLLDRQEFTGTYLGFDILRRHIAWCSAVVTNVDPRFVFALLDVRNERYNPEGTLDPATTPFPAASASIEVCALFSVFTHLYRSTVEHYLSEIARALRPGGVAVTTWLLFDDERLAAVASDDSEYPLRLQGTDGTRFMLAEDPLRAIGYPTQDVVTMARKAGLEVVEVELGYWVEGHTADANGREFQDMVTLRRT